jgi:methyltransferase
MSISYIILLSFFLLTGILRIFELKLAKRNYLHRKKKEVPVLEHSENYFFLFIVLHISFLVTVPLEVLILKEQFNFWLGVFSALIYFSCLMLRFHILKTLGKSWNTKIFYDPNSENWVVTDGIYKYIRHPNYLVVIMEIASLSLFHSAFNSFLFFTIANFCLLYVRIKNEEKALFLNPYYRKNFENKKRFIPYLF